MSVEGALCSAWITATNTQISSSLDQRPISRMFKQYLCLVYTVWCRWNAVYMGKCAATKAQSEWFIARDIRGLINANNVPVSRFHTNASRALREFVKWRSSTQICQSRGDGNFDKFIANLVWNIGWRRF